MPIVVAAEQRNGGRQPVFQVSVPYLDDSAIGASGFANSVILHRDGPSSPADTMSPRGTSPSGGRRRVSSPPTSHDATPAKSSPPSAVRGGASAGRYNAVNPSRHQSDYGTSGGPGNTALTKPILAPAHIRCCSVDQWVPDAHVMNCMAPDCGTSFSLFSRRYHCKMCGRVFCSACCATVITIPGGVASSSVALYAAATSTAAGAAGGSAGRGPSTAPSADRGAGAGGDAAASAAAMMNNMAAVYASGPLSPTLRSSSVSFGMAPPGPGEVPPTVLGPATLRVCNGCRYELHLVVSTRQENGELRRKSRGELKMLQKALLVNILSFLPLSDLLEMALVSSDFYFMSKDNFIWYQYNMTRWLKDAEQTRTQLSLASSVVAPGRSSRRRLGMLVGGGGSTSPAPFQAAPMLQDATALTESEAAKRVISLHARYSFTQFLDFTRRHEMARCEGMSSFSVGSRILFSSPVRVALIGPSGVGKTTALRGFVGEVEGAGGAVAAQAAADAPLHPTVGFSRVVRVVKLVGDLTTEVTLHVYDVSGDTRYEALRRFICAQCHVIALCYDPSRKETLVSAADIMMGIENSLGPQPVVVCGLLRGAAAPMSRMNGERLPLHSIAVSPPTSATASVAKGDVGGVGSTSAADPAGSATSSVAAGGPSSTGAGSTTDLAVSEEDAIAISVRTAGSLQCPTGACEPLFSKLIQCLLDRLAVATMAGNATVADISGEMGDRSSLSGSTLSATAAGRRSTPHSAAASGRSTRRPQASKVTAQELLNLTMQPCALEVLLDRK